MHLVVHCKSLSRCAYSNSESPSSSSSAPIALPVLWLYIWYVTILAVLHSGVSILTNACANNIDVMCVPSLLESTIWVLRCCPISKHCHLCKSIHILMMMMMMMINMFTTDHENGISSSHGLSIVQQHVTRDPSIDKLSCYRRLHHRIDLSCGFYKGLPALYCCD